MDIDSNYENLLALLESKNYEVREKAVVALGAYQNEQAFDVLAAVLENDKSSAVKLTAVRVLRKLADKRVCQFLLKMFHSLKGTACYLATDDGIEEDDVRDEIISSLGELGGKEANPVLIEAIKDDSYGVRVAAILKIGYLANFEAVDVLISVLTDKEAEIREVAAQALYRIGDKRAVEPIIPLLSDENPTVQRIAITALNMLEAEEHLIKEPLLNLARNPKLDGYARLYALTVAAKFDSKNKEILDLLLELKSDSTNNSFVRGEATRLYEEYTKLD